MITNFRQGIITYPSAGGVQQFLVPSSNSVTLSAVNGVTDIAFAHRSSNYLHTESVTVPQAWSNLPSNAVVWLYWDLHNITAVRTFGYTTLEPIAQPTAPLPELDQHWFDTSTNIMKVWNGVRWQEKIRVFAAEYNTSNNTFISVSVHSTLQRFDGTQVGIQGDHYNVGRIIVDNTGRPITNQHNEFFTTEDDFFVNGSPINTIRLEANILTASPIENIASYHVVKFSSFGKVSLASYNDTETTALAMAMQDVMLGDVGAFVVQGIITNPSWNWPVVGASLWLDVNGTLTPQDPHITDPIAHPNGKAPVGRVLTPTSIIFDQGLGGKGERGESALLNTSTDAATVFDLGKVKMSVPPSDPGSPYAVGTNDPRMTDARQPLAHTHTATDVIPAVHGTNVNGTLQTTLINLENAKLNKTGDTMSGALILNGNPTNPLGAVTKQYADLFIEKSQKGSANGVATLGFDGKIPTAQLPQIALTDTFVVNSQVEMLALNAQVGDLCIRTDLNTTFILRNTGANLHSNWQELLTSPDGVMSINVTPAVGQQGITTSGGPITSTGTISISLANDLAALEGLSGSGVAHRTGNDTWEVRAVDLANSVTGTLSPSRGGTGLDDPVGYIRGNGSVMEAVTSIPGTHITGTVPASLSAPWSGITGKPTTLAGYGITDAYTTTQTNNLTWNWSSITNRPTTLIGYGITDVYSKTEVNTFLTSKANTATTLAGYGITDASPLNHSHLLDNLTNVNTSGKSSGDVILWNGTHWVSSTVSNAVLPTIISNKVIDSTNTIGVKDDNFTIENTIDDTKQLKFDVSGVSPSTTITLSTPISSGTIALTDGTGASGTWNITSSTSLSAPWSGITGKPTTLAGYGITDAYTTTQTNALTWNWSSITDRPTTLAGYGIINAYTADQIDGMIWDWSSITNRPTTLSGYGITDAYTTTQTDNLTWNWSSITNRPTTLAGYGITDAAPSTHTHVGQYVAVSDVGVTVASLDITGKLQLTQIPDQAITNTFSVDDEIAMLSLPATTGDIAIRSDISTTFVLVTDDPSNVTNWAALLSPSAIGGGSVTSVGITPPTSGISVSNSPITSAGNITLTLTDDLAAVESLSSTGIVLRVANNNWTTTSSLDINSQTSGILSMVRGGTGASTAVVARNNLGVPALDGTGASGIWNIDISGNATTVTNGVYTNQAYNDPSWIASLDPNKVVSVWEGSTAINTVSNILHFDNNTTISTGQLHTLDDSPAVLHSFDVDQYSSAKYLIQVTRDDGAIQVKEIYVLVDGNNNIFITETGPTTATISQFLAVFDGTNTVNLFCQSLTVADVVYKFTTTMMTM